MAVADPVPDQGGERLGGVAGDLLGEDRRGRRRSGSGAGAGTGGDRGQASNVPATAAGTIGTRARGARTAIPGLSSPSRPSRLRVPSGKRSTIPPLRSRRRVSFRPEAPIPSRWIGNPPTERMNGPEEREEEGRARHVVQRPGRRDAEDEDVEVAEVVRDEQHAALAGMCCRPVARRPPTATRKIDAVSRTASYQTRASRERSRSEPARRRSAAARDAGGRLTAGPPGRTRPGPVEAVADVALDPGDDLVEAQPGGVDDGGVGGGLHRGDGAGGVAGVAVAEVARTASRAIGSPRAANSAWRRRARSSRLAVRKNLRRASGKTTVPWSRPSATTSYSAANSRCQLTSRRRTLGLSATSRWRG